MIFRFPEEGPEIFLSVIYFVERLLFKPFYSFAFFPEAVLDGDHGRVIVLVQCLVHTKSMLLTAHPLTHINATVCPLVNTVTMLFVVLILAHVAPAVSPGVYTHSVHVVVEPFALELTTVEPTVCAESLDLVFVPLTLIL